MWIISTLAISGPSHKVGRLDITYRLKFTRVLQFSHKEGQFLNTFKRLIKFYLLRVNL
jgi:hypothetical protein